MQFHFDQSKVRSEIRLREGRARPIDVLTKHLNGSDDLDIEINEPYMVFKVNTKRFSFIFFLLFLIVVMSCSMIKDIQILNVNIIEHVT